MLNGKIWKVWRKIISKQVGFDLFIICPVFLEITFLNPEIEREIFFFLSENGMYHLSISCITKIVGWIKNMVGGLKFHYIFLNLVELSWALKAECGNKEKDRLGTVVWLASLASKMEPSVALKWGQQTFKMCTDGC